MSSNGRRQTRTRESGRSSRYDVSLFWATMRQKMSGVSGQKPLTSRDAAAMKSLEIEKPPRLYKHSLGKLAGKLAGRIELVATKLEEESLGLAMNIIVCWLTFTSAWDLCITATMRNFENVFVSTDYLRYISACCRERRSQGPGHLYTPATIGVSPSCQVDTRRDAFLLGDYEIF